MIGEGACQCSAMSHRRDEPEKLESFYTQYWRRSALFLLQDAGNAFMARRQEKVFVLKPFDGRRMCGQWQPCRFPRARPCFGRRFHAKAWSSAAQAKAHRARPHYHPNYYGAYVRDPVISCGCHSKRDSLL